MHYYIHIPFCNQKCPYCKFALTPVFDEIKKKRYLKFLEKEIQFFFQENPKYCNKTCNTIYFGGGTPSILTVNEIENILKKFPHYQEHKTKFGQKEYKCDSDTERARNYHRYLSEGKYAFCRKKSYEETPRYEETYKKETIEITIECNPEDINKNLIEGIILLGVNRISLGIQSLNDKTLREIHRSNKTSIFNALYTIQSIIDKHKYKNMNINVDFILGLPFDMEGNILKNIQELHKKFPCITSTSVYMLEQEIYPKHWKNNSLSEDENNVEFEQILHYFEGKKWNHYELSNFAKKGYECQHNKAYWQHKNYRGFGLSASSFIDSKRFTNSPSFSGYYSHKIINEERITNEQKELEKLLFGMRTNGYKINPKIPIINTEKIQEYLNQGILLGNKASFSCSKKGIPILDTILSDILL